MDYHQPHGYMRPPPPPQPPPSAADPYQRPPPPVPPPPSNHPWPYSSTQFQYQPQTQHSPLLLRRTGRRLTPLTTLSTLLLLRLLQLTLGTRLRRIMRTHTTHPHIHCRLDRLTFPNLTLRYFN
ncbi:UNVERIFIED_CONTAM: hypothetical protein Sradi_4821500 [Sesamum radiatum]|uniref:Uncharacterized protein n=1 Tax=Sesamum radiatum TaxID=300843 RepID=A0AAW2N093_SESRA